VATATGFAMNAVCDVNKIILWNQNCQIDPD